MTSFLFGTVAGFVAAPITGVLFAHGGIRALARVWRIRSDAAA
jgi:hypothetical protein